MTPPARSTKSPPRAGLPSETIGFSPKGASHEDQYALAIAALTVAGTAAAATKEFPEAPEYTGTHINLCAKGDQPDAFRAIISPYAEPVAVVRAAQAAGGCFQRLGRLGDAGYALNGVVLLKHQSGEFFHYNVYSNGVRGGQVWARGGATVHPVVVEDGKIVVRFD